MSGVFWASMTYAIEHMRVLLTLAEMHDKAIVRDSINSEELSRLIEGTSADIVRKIRGGA